MQEAGHVVLSTTEVDEDGNTRIFGGDDVLKRIGARPGNTLIPNDTDGVIRHVPYETQKLKSFGIVAAEIAAGRTIPARARTASGSTTPARPTRCAITRTRASCAGRCRRPRSATRSSCSGGGDVAPGLPLHPDSGDDADAGAEVQANVAETALHGFPLRSLWFGWNFVLIVLSR